MKSISIVRCNDYTQDLVFKAVEKTFKNLGGVNRFIKPGMNVMIKANLLMKRQPDEATTTNPAVIEAIAKVVRAAGGNPTIIDSPGGPYTEGLLKSIYETTGMNTAAINSGAKLNFDLGIKEIENPDGKLLKHLTILKPLADADLVINVPKLKTHGMMVFTGAVKNMFGAIPGEQKIKYHLSMPTYDDFANALIDIYLSVKPGLNIIDGIIGMDGHGPSSGNPKEIGLIMAGEDGFALDLAALSVTGISPTQVPIYKNAILRKLCPENTSEIAVTGIGLEEARLKSFDVPMLTRMKSSQFIKDGLFKTILDRLNPSPYFNSKICIGCAACARSCPVKIIKMVQNRPVMNSAKCIRCFCCQELCPVKAVTIRKPLVGQFVFFFGSYIAAKILQIRKKRHENRK